MSAYQTEDQVREDCIARMGADLGPLYDELSQQLAFLHLKWEQYRLLYGTDAARVDLLNRTAPLLFALLQTSLADDVLLHLARLTDPPQSMGYDNLTLRRLLPLAHDQSMHAEVERLLAVTMAASAFARDWRNQRLAHIDLETLRQGQARPLPTATGQCIDAALGAMRDLLNCFDGDVRYGVVAAPGDADALVYYLTLGLEAANNRLP